jgi:predicted nucleotidyltransferase
MDLLQKSDYIIFETIAGSHAYGTNIATSDIDIRGIFRLPKDNYDSLITPCQEVSNDSEDIKYYELKKYIDLAKDCNPNIIELFWMPKDVIKICTPIMEQLLSYRTKFITKRAYHTFSGYAYAQIEKAKGKNKKVHNPKPIEKPIHEQYCYYIPTISLQNYVNYKNPNRKKISQPIEISETDIDLKKFHCAAVKHTSHLYRLYYYGDSAKGVFRGDNMLTCESIPLEDEEPKFAGLLLYNPDLYQKELNDWKSYWDWMKNRNTARWIDQEKGLIEYDTKNMAHCVRLLLSGKNILTNGEPIVRFQGKDLEFLKAIRAGNYKYEDIMNYVTNAMSELKILSQNSTLPSDANIKEIDQIYKEIRNM